MEFRFDMTRASSRKKRQNKNDFGKENLKRGSFPKLYIGKKFKEGYFLS